MAEEESFAFGDDAPKKSSSDDRLNYAPFAQRIADAIVRLDAPNGYVIGLHGKWGSGKSTVLSFVIEYLTQHNDNRIVPIEFRPWIITGDHDLIAAFFKVLTETLAPTDKRRWWRRDQVQSLNNEKALALVDAVTTLGLAVADPTGTGLMSALATTAKKTVNRLTGQYLKIPSLQKAYEDLSNKLRDSGERYLVVIDDIDRLKDRDVRSIMQMVKSVGQLPNVIYLLAYDREIVWNAFGRDAIRAEPSFAEKIVQQELQLPVPSKNSLLTMLDNEIPFVREGTENSLRWEHIVQDGLRRWIESPRDVVRLSNALKFSWPALEGEIDPQDLLAIEGLRLFDFEVFEWLRDNRDYLFSTGRFQLSDEDLRPRTIGGLKQLVPEEIWTQIRPLVTQLFPQIARDLKDTLSVSGVDPDQVRKRRGIGSEAGYDTYFGLYPSPDAISLATVNGLVVAGENSEAVESCLRDYIQRKNSQGGPMIGEVLDELKVRFRGAQSARPQQALLDALFAVGEEVISLDYKPNWSSVPPRAQLDSLVREMLCRWGPGDAGQRLVEAFEMVDSPAFLADVYVSLGRDLGVFHSDSRDQCPITQQDFAEIGRILIRKIETAKKNDTLHHAPFYYSIARAWGYLSGPDEPKSWLMEGIVQNEEFMAKTCLGLVGTSLVASGNRRFEMMSNPDPEFYDIETLRAAGRAHQLSAYLTDEKRDLITAVTRGCEKLLSDQENRGSD